jgi:hypothetical protein
MAEHLQAADQQAVQSIAAKLDMLEHLSDDEVQKLLAELKQQD